MQKRLKEQPSVLSSLSSNGEEGDDDLNELDVNDLLESFKEHCSTFVQNAYLYVRMVTIELLLFFILFF